MKQALLLAFVSLASFSCPLFGQAKDNFLKQQAFEEMQRVSGQVDCLEQNHNDLVNRVSKIEPMKQEIADLKSLVSSLQAQVADLKAALAKQREEIVNDLASRIKQEENRRPAPPPPASAYDGPTKLYTVAAGDNLTIISEAFGTKVQTIKELNDLKSNNIRIGQKLRVPAK